MLIGDINQDKSFQKNPKPINLEIVGARLKELRKERNKEDINNKWTQEYVANLLGISRSAYALYEVGENPPPIEVLIKLADIYGGVSVDYILGRQDDKSVKTDILVDAFSHKIINLLNRLPEGKKEKFLYMLYGAILNEEVD